MNQSEVEGFGGLTVSHVPLQDRVYWTDLEDEAIYSANRHTGHDVATLAQHLNNPLDVVVFHELRQPKGEAIV